MMYKQLKLLTFIACMLSSLTSFGAYYDTLPKGVRTFVYRYVETSDIDSEFNQRQSLSPYSYNFQIDAKMLESLPEFTSAVNYLKSVSFDAYENFKIGEYGISANAQVEVDGFGFGWGLSSRLTAYGILPFYKATVNMNYNRVASNNFNEVGSDLQDNYSDSIGQVIGQALGQFPDVGAAELQHILTNDLGYSEIGTWEGSDIGDLELGLIYNLKKEDNWGAAVATGIVAPTGREDDPDLLQDIAFGDGQWDVFFELGGGYHLSSNLLVNSFFRYTYQLPTEKELRVPHSSEVNISKFKDYFDEKLGNIFMYNINSEFMVNDWISVIGAYEYHYKEENSYESSRVTSNDILAVNSDYTKHNLRFSLEFSSVNLFQKKEFLLPGKITIGYQNTFSGMNTPKLKQYEIEFRMFF